ncbi:PREDICTED: keratin, type II cytoskeletal 8-like [Gekko japonicus]|uniref:Keratin, type II cytoskeletal 8-like n=1 Tax=Gekko japonicus TaxID=146911 RepID=A0ABM1LEY4_GEKJA|nr:PREDICTED: keratin, type II cytoskeletal 8-like [Gekko japonicus]
MGHGGKNPGSAAGRSHSRCLGGLGGLDDYSRGNSGGKGGGHSGESNGDTGGYGDRETYSSRDQGEKCENNYVDLGAHGRCSGGGSLGGHLGRRGNICDIGQGRRTQRVHINESLQNPVKVDTDPEIQRVQMEEKEQIKNLKRQCDSCINKVHILEQRNTALSTQWELLQQQRLERKSLRNTESLFQSYMQDMRMLLGTVQGQKGQLLWELRQLQAITEDCEKRHKEEHNKRLATENEFAALKKDIDTAYKDNMDLDVKTDLLVEQIVRLRGIYEMELTELQRRVHDGPSDIVFMNKHGNLNIDNFLEEVRCQYEEIAQRSKEEVDARCQGKYEELHTMCCIHREHLLNSHQELQELTHRIQTLKMEIGKLKKKVRQQLTLTFRTV